jgi:hypothetical protein
VAGACLNFSALLHSKLQFTRRSEYSNTHCYTTTTLQAAASTAEGAALCTLWLAAAAAAHSAQCATAAAQAAAATADTQGPTVAACASDAAATATVAWPLDEYPEVYDWGSDAPMAAAEAHQVKATYTAIVCYSNLCSIVSELQQ